MMTCEETPIDRDALAAAEGAIVATIERLMGDDAAPDIIAWLFLDCALEAYEMAFGPTKVAAWLRRAADAAEKATGSPN